MKIRNRITIYFALITAFILLLSFSYFYLHFNSFVEESFKERLKERVTLSEKFLLELEKLEGNERKRIEKEFYKKLDSEIGTAISVMDAKKYFQNSPDWDFLKPKDIINLITQSEYYFISKSFQGASKKYKINDKTYIVTVAAENKQGIKFLNQVGYELILVFIFSVSLIAISSYFFSSNILKPLSEKIKKANAIGVHNLDERLIVYSENDEIGKLAKAFNGMLDRIEDAFMIQKNFVKYASHEMKNPLAAVLGEIEVTLNNKRTTNEYISTLKKIETQIERVNQLIDNFLKMPTKETIQTTSIRVDEVLFQQVLKWKLFYDEQEIELSVDEKLNEKDLYQSLDLNLFLVVFDNLIDNAVKFGEGEIIVLKLYKQNSLNISITNKGKIIDKKEVDFIFHPMYRASNAKDIEGSGMGLSIVKRIIDVHGFMIEVEVNNSQTTFLISF